MMQTGQGSPAFMASTIMRRMRVSCSGLTGMVITSTLGICTLFLVGDWSSQEYASIYVLVFQVSFKLFRFWIAELRRSACWRAMSPS